MRRRLFTAVSVLSLALFAATPFLWAASGLRGAHWIYAYDSRGKNGIVSQHYIDLTLSRGLVFKWYANDWNYWRQLTIPFWVLAVFSAVLPTVWLVRRRTESPDSDRPCCRFCGYNLTGNTSGVCPECGTPTTAGARA